ncbi:CaiB/BaiF CoA transferase family protein [Ottowia thiooxydans]|uniref:CaiB/BaiF CoA transferase family protein n=1 Tax=Ottowia thiooxydans TaxID=219182 RepID=UPI001FDEE990|nr:CaiB/BaiF CoA-transferase family protein [Ottowia thiooxydans]
MADQMGPLSGLKVIEMAGIGPAPFGVTLLADAGMEVIRIERSSGSVSPAGAVNAAQDPLLRGRRCISLDLKNPQGREVVLRLLEHADALVEGFRPGVMERLGLGPEVCMKHRPSLVYGRMTGWGQNGPLSNEAGHDINYIALSGALHAIGLPEKPVLPLNLVGDFGGGGTLLAFGVTSALISALRTGRGQVVDAAMSDGAALLMAPFYAKLAAGSWTDERGANVLDGAAPHYGVYPCADGKFIAVGPLEPQFYSSFLARLGLSEDPLFGKRAQREMWPQLRERLEQVFLTRPRDAWCNLFEGSDACVAPVLSMAEAPSHPHNLARETFMDAGGAMVPGPAPRFGTGDRQMPPAPQRDSQTTDELLHLAGYSDTEIVSLRADGIVNS